MAKRALLIYNPAARGAPPIDRLRAALDDLADWETSLETTVGVGHAIELARHAAERQLDAVVACGGDGTVNEVVNGLAHSETMLAVVRAGTANVWAKETHVPREAAEAVRLLEQGEQRTVDLGRAGERYFLLMAGVGFDAAIIRNSSRALKRRLGAAAYLIQGAMRTFSHRSVATELEVNGNLQAERLYWMLVSNTRNYGGVIDIANEAIANDGQLDLWLLRTGGPHRLAWLAMLVPFKRHRHHPELRRETVRSVEVSEPGLPVQVDGDYLGETPMRFEVVPSALRVLVPRGLRIPLFAT